MAIITLPRKAIRKLNKNSVTIEIKTSTLGKTYADLETIKKTKGLLKKKKSSELLNYIEETRNEWEDK